jgi:solute carrier family 13 (sodium-dependent dicarboxylate transporter), member 2/3/5
VGAWMAVWWMTEAVPLPVTSLLPLVLFPLLGVTTTDEAAAPYADKNVFLFLGGFLIALAVERWNLHRRLALLTVLAVGTQPRRLIGGIMLATAGLSMWMSNTATTAMMLPIGLSLLALVRESRDRERGSSSRGPAVVEEEVAPTERSPSPPAAGELEVAGEGSGGAESFATCMMLSIAYSASIGGLGTLVGTPTNLYLAGFAGREGIPISFAGWMLFSIPLATLYLVSAWWLLTHWLFPVGKRDIAGGEALIRAELKKLGAVQRGEWTVLAVFLVVAAAWVLRGPLSQWTWLVSHFPWVGRLDDTMIAVAGAIALFVIPVDLSRGVFALDWSVTKRLPWGVLLLFGGGFSLAAAVSSSELATWVGSSIQVLAGWPPLLLTLAVVVLMMFSTELTSNTPTTAAFVPILFGVAVEIGVDPLLLIVPATLAASCAFMLPVATPPNAIVFGSGAVTIRAMIRAGIWLNLLGILLIPLYAAIALRWCF